MHEPRFLQIHWLCSYPASLPNRDEYGLAKRISFGGATRLRISSQAIKRRIKVAEDDQQLSAIPNVMMSVRSRHLVREAILKGLCTELGKPAEWEDALAPILERALYGEKGDVEESRQSILLGEPEVRFLREKARTILTASEGPKDVVHQANGFVSGFRSAMKAMREATEVPFGLEAALFGRFATSDPAANIDGAVHVAHALSVHPIESEIDFVTSVDDLDKDTRQAAGIFNAELTSGLYYGYMVVDVPGLVSNLTGRPRGQWLNKNVDRTLAGEVCSRLIYLVSTVSLAAKRVATAPYAFADTVMVELGRRQPRSLANAFFDPVSLEGDVAARARQRLFEEAEAIDENFGSHEQRQVMSRGAVPPAFPKRSLDQLRNFAREAITAGRY